MVLLMNDKIDVHDTAVRCRHTPCTRLTLQCHRCRWFGLSRQSGSTCACTRTELPAGRRAAALCAGCYDMTRACAVQCVLELSKAVGAEGLVAGQVVDIKSEGSEGEFCVSSYQICRLPSQLFAHHWSRSLETLQHLPRATSLCLLSGSAALLIAAALLHSSQ